MRCIVTCLILESCVHTKHIQSYEILHVPIRLYELQNKNIVFSYAYVVIHSLGNAKFNIL